MNIITLIRIDNRLIHGQVGVTWANSLNINRIIVVDDSVAKDKLQQILMESIVKSGGFKIDFYTIDDFMINNNKTNYKVFLIVRDIEVLKKLVDKGLKIGSCNVGNSHYEKGKIALNKKVYVSESEIECYKYLINSGIKFYIQDVPGTLHEEITLDKLNDLSFRR